MSLTATCALTSGLFPGVQLSVGLVDSDPDLALFINDWATWGSFCC